MTITGELQSFLARTLTPTNITILFQGWVSLNTEECWVIIFSGTWFILHSSIKHYSYFLNKIIIMTLNGIFLTFYDRCGLKWLNWAVEPPFINKEIKSYEEKWIKLFSNGDIDVEDEFGGQEKLVTKILGWQWCC